MYTICIHTCLYIRSGPALTCCVCALISNTGLSGLAVHEATHSCFCSSVSEFMSAWLMRISGMNWYVDVATGDHLACCLPKPFLDNTRIAPTRGAWVTGSGRHDIIRKFALPRDRSQANLLPPRELGDEDVLASVRIGVVVVVVVVVVDAAPSPAIERVIVVHVVGGVVVVVATATPAVPAAPTVGVEPHAQAAAPLAAATAATATAAAAATATTADAAAPTSHAVDGHDFPSDLGRADVFQVAASNVQAILGLAGHVQLEQDTSGPLLVFDVGILPGKGRRRKSEIAANRLFRFVAGVILLLLFFSSLQPRAHKDPSSLPAQTPFQ